MKLSKYVKFGALAFSVFFTANSQAADPIRIGTVLSSTGPAAYIGEPELRTLRLYVDKINADGGIIGRKLELVAYDDVTDASKARTFATRLVERDQVVAVVGGSTTGTSMAIIPVFEKAKIPFMSLAGSIQIVEPVKKYVFKSPHTDKMACESVFADMKRRGIKNVAFMSGNDGFGVSMREQCIKVAPNFDIQIVMDEGYGAQDTDMTTQLAKIKANQDVQAIFNLGASGQGPAIVTRNYGQLGMTEIPLYQNHGVASKSFIELAGKASEGVRLPASALLVADKLPDDDKQKPIVIRYTTEYEKATGLPVSTFGGHAYDGLMMVVRAIEAANSDDPQKIRDALEKTHDFIGTAGVVNMSATDHLGLGNEAFRMVEIKNGEWGLVQ